MALGFHRFVVPDSPGLTIKTQSTPSIAATTAGRVHGATIEEISRDNTTPTTTIRLLEFSEALLDSSLFDVPSGYQPGLPLLGGGFDLTKPDTLMDRVDNYWLALTSWVHRVSGF